MKQQSFTLITGASEGLGKFMAFEFARRQHPLILVALPGSPLTFVANYIRTEFQVPVHAVFADLSTVEGCIELHRQVQAFGLSVRILVNNAGIGNTDPFHAKSVRYYQQQIGVNVVAPVTLSRLFLAMMTGQDGAAILNVSSLTSYFPIPNKQVYCGTKAFLMSFSRALNYEMEASGVRVSVVCPGGMNTRIPIILATKERTGISRWSIMDPERVALITVNKFMQGCQVIIPGRWNRFFIVVNRFLPGFMRRGIIRKQISDAQTFESNQQMTPIYAAVKWLEPQSAA